MNLLLHALILFIAMQTSSAAVSEIAFWHSQRDDKTFCVIVQNNTAAELRVKTLAGTNALASANAFVSFTKHTTYPTFSVPKDTMFVHDLAQVSNKRLLPGQEEPIHTLIASAKIRHKEIEKSIDALSKKVIAEHSVDTWQKELEAITEQTNDETYYDEAEVIEEVVQQDLMIDRDCEPAEWLDLNHEYPLDMIFVDMSFSFKEKLKHDLRRGLTLANAWHREDFKCIGFEKIETLCKKIIAAAAKHLLKKLFAHEARTGVLVITSDEKATVEKFLRGAQCSKIASHTQASTRPKKLNTLLSTWYRTTPTLPASA